MWDPDQVSPEQLNQYRQAAEAAWGDDTRSPQYVGHPQPSAGHCYVTSAWLQNQLGGHIGTKDGHYFWVSPDRSHVIDLTGDRYASEPHDPQIEGVQMDSEDEPWTYDPEHTRWHPGPVMYKRADHPLYKGFRVVEPSEGEAAKRAQLFIRRANSTLSGHHTADLMGADPYPGESPERIDEMDQLYHHDEPDYEPERNRREYRFVFANGQLHVSPVHEHADLLDHAGVEEDHSGPTAIGYAVVTDGKALWKVESNVGLAGLRDMLEHYSREVGWRFEGLVGTDGQPMGFGPVMTYWYAKDGDRVMISQRPLRLGHRIDVRDDTAYVPEILPGLQEWASDANLRIAEVPGGGNMLDKMKREQDIEMWDRQDPDWKPRPAPQDTEPTGPFACPHCGFKPRTFGEYKLHMDEHNGRPDEVEDGRFPQIDDFDEPLPLRRLQPYPEMAWNGVQAHVMVLPNAHEARRLPDFDLYSNLFGFEKPGNIIYGAYRHGELIGYGVVRPVPRDPRMAEVMMIQSAVSGKGVGTAILARMQRHFDRLYSHSDSPAGEALMRRVGMVNTWRHRWRWAKGSDPKDMLEADVPFVYDIQRDRLEVGYPGTNTHDVPGQFTPGGIVEGYYQPGGKVVIQTASSWPFSVRHLLDLWYWTAPQMEVTSVEQTNTDGSTDKLAATEGPAVGQYIRSLVPTDPAAEAAYRALRAAGGQVYAVGGAVRDALLGRIPNDIDLMVSGLPSAEVLHTLKQLPGVVNETGKRFGVFRYKPHGGPGAPEVEIALPRTDLYESGRRGEGQITVDHNLPVEKDLERRDFTANSMAVDLDTGKLIDPYGGASDIGRGVLRTTHRDAFREDPTRLVRALTAHGRFGLNPDERTRAELRDHAALLRGESPDALNKTIDKLMKSENPAGALRLGHDTGVLQHLFPEVDDNWDYDQNNAHHKLPLGDHLMHTLDNVSRLTTDPDVRMAALLHDVGKPASAWVDPDTGQSHYYRNTETGEGADHEKVGAQMAEDRLRTLNYPVARINRVHALVAHHMFPAFSTAKGARRFLSRVGDHADDLLHIRQADQEGKGQTPQELAARTQADQMRQLVEQARQQGAPTDTSALNIGGNDLLQMGLKPGPAVGTVLRQLTNDVVDEPMLNEPDALRERAQQYVNAQPPEAFS